MERIKIAGNGQAGSETLSVKDGGILVDTIVFSSDHMSVRGLLSDALHFSNGESVDVKTDLFPNSEKMTITVNGNEFILNAADVIPFHPTNFIRRTSVPYVRIGTERYRIMGSEGSYYITTGSPSTQIALTINNEDFLKQKYNTENIDGIIQVYTEEHPIAVINDQSYDIVYDEENSITGENVVMFVNSNEVPPISRGNAIALQIAPKRYASCAIYTKEGEDGRFITLNGVEYPVIENLKYVTSVKGENVRIEPTYNSDDEIRYFTSVDGEMKFTILRNDDEIWVKRMTSNGSFSESQTGDTTTINWVESRVYSYNGVVINGVEYFEETAGYIIVETDLVYGIVNEVTYNRIGLTLLEPSVSISTIHYAYKVGGPFYQFGKTDEEIQAIIKDSLIIHHEYGGYNVPLIGANGFATNMHQEDIVPNVLFEEVKNKVLSEKKNQIVDMERDIYVPGFKSTYGDTPQDFDNVLEVRFNLHFRTRNLDTWEVIEDDKSPESLGKCNWFITDYYLPPEKLISKTNRGTKGTLVDSYGQKMLHSSDLLGFAGFNDDDIKFKKQRLSRSFLRLYFYDSPDPSQQSLLWQSTMFIDENQLYGEYIRNNQSDKFFVDVTNGLDFQVRYITEDKKLTGTTADYNYTGYLILRNQCECAIQRLGTGDMDVVVNDRKDMKFNIGDNVYIEQYVSGVRKKFVYNISDIDDTTLKLTKRSGGKDDGSISNGYPVDVFLLQYAGNDFSVNGFDGALSVFDEEITTYTIDENYNIQSESQLPPLNVDYYVPSFDEKNRLTSRIAARNRLEGSHCSEGFYVQLFKEYSRHMHPRTIYMKVEFNHAGYGKRVPFMRLTTKNENGESTGREITSLTQINNSVKAGYTVQEVYENMMIPLQVIYDDKKGRYTYYYEGNHSKVMTFNLFEVKFKTTEIVEGEAVTRKSSKGVLSYSRFKTTEGGITERHIKGPSSFTVSQAASDFRLDIDQSLAPYITTAVTAVSESKTAIQVTLSDAIIDLDLATVQTFQRAIKKVSKNPDTGEYDEENPEYLSININDSMSGFDLYRPATASEIASSRVTKYYLNDCEFLSNDVINMYYADEAEEMKEDDKAHLLFSADTQMMEYVIPSSGASMLGSVVTQYGKWEFSDIQYYGDGGGGWLSVEYRKDDEHNIVMEAQPNLYGGARIASFTLNRIGGSELKQSARIRVRQAANENYYSVIYNNKTLLQGSRNITYKPQIEAGRGEESSASTADTVGILSIVWDQTKTLTLESRESVSAVTGSPRIEIVGMPVQGSSIAKLNGQSIVVESMNDGDNLARVNISVNMYCRQKHMYSQAENYVKISIDGVYQDTVMFYKQKQNKKSVSILPKVDKTTVVTGTKTPFIRKVKPRT